MTERTWTAVRGPVITTALAIGAMALLEGGAPAGASEVDRISAGGIHIPTIMNFCGTDEIMIKATICNEGTDSRTWELGFFDGGTPPAYACTESVIPPHTFVDPVPVTVPPGQCRDVRIRIERPAELDANANVCYWILFTPDQGGVVGLGAQLIDTFVTCIDWRRFEEQVIFMHPLDPVILDPEVVNNSAQPIVFDYVLEVRNEENSPEQTVIRLNDEEPGRPIFGSIDLPPGASASLPLVVEWSEPDVGGYFDVVIMADVPGGRVTVGDLGSIGLFNADRILVAVEEPDVSPGVAPPLGVSPNPWSSGQLLSIRVDAQEWTSLTVHDATGRIVHRARPGEGAPANLLTWDGVDLAGHRVSAGAYFVRLVSERGARTVKVVLLP